MSWTRLGKMDYGWLGGGTAADTLPNYSSPSGPEGGVGNTTIEQWIFDEAFGNPTGEENGTILTQTGSPIYNSTIGGDFVNLSPGIDVNASGIFQKAADSLFDFGAGRTFYMKAYLEREGTGRYTIFATLNATGVLFELLDTSAARDVFVYVDDASNNISSTIVTMSQSYVDGTVHKFLAKVIPGGAVTVTVDDVLEATGTSASIADTVTAANVCAANYLGTRMLDGKIYELHISEDV